MYENESAKVKLGIEFLSALIEKDYRTDPTFDIQDLGAKMLEIGDDIKFLQSNLNLEVADDVEEAREELADDTLEEDELEDEIVECTRLVDTALTLYDAVRKRYFPLDESEEKKIQEKVFAEDSTSKAQPIRKRKRHLDNASQLGVFIVVLLAIIVLIGFLTGSFD